MPELKLILPDSPIQCAFSYTSASQLYFQYYLVRSLFRLFPNHSPLKTFNKKYICLYNWPFDQPQTIVNLSYVPPPKNQFHLPRRMFPIDKADTHWIVM